MGIWLVFAEGLPERHTIGDAYLLLEIENGFHGSLAAEKFQYDSG